MWNLFAASVGAAAAGLTGLTFIVVAFRFHTIARSSEYRNRAAQALILFLTVTITAATVTVPQSSIALGVELSIAALLVGGILLRVDRAARAETDRRPQVALVVALSAFVTLILVAGILLAVGWPNGLYFYALAALLGIAWGAYGAWVFLTRAGIDTGSAPRSDA